MEATLSLCWFTPRWMYFAHIGDSRIYYLPAREAGIKQLSQDDTMLTGYFAMDRSMNARPVPTPDAMCSKKPSAAITSLFDPQLGAVAYEVGDIFLLCTDGLVEGLYDNHLFELLRPLVSAGANANPARRLVEESLKKDGRENTTALVIQTA